MRHAGEEKNCTRLWWESLKERDHLEDRVLDGRLGSEWMLGRWVEWGVNLVGTG
jgi:hypothetical protein